MRVCREIDFNDLRNMVWSGATNTVENIAKANMGDELMNLLVEMYIDDIPTETEINDFLWFDDEYIYTTLGLNEDGEVDDEEDEELDTDKLNELIENTINRIDESDDFESFCDDCEKCALDRIEGTMERCKEVFKAYQRGIFTDDDIIRMVV